MKVTYTILAVSVVLFAGIWSGTDPLVPALEAQQAAPPTFNKDVAPIIYENCVVCHRPNQVAPMSLLSYKEVRPWARAIKQRTTKREMPPWFADPRFGEFHNDPRLSDEEIRTLAAWADAGAPEGDTPLAVQPPKPNDGWTHPSGRDPDLIIEMAQAFDGPAQGEIPWFNIYQVVPEELRGKEFMIEAAQMLPGVIPAVHHINFNISPLPKGTKVGTGEGWPGGLIIPNGALLDAETGRLSATGAESNGGMGVRGEASGFTYCCYRPGGGFKQFRDGGYQRMRVPENGIIVWGMHYTLIGKSFADKSKIGLWFQKDPKHEVIIGSGPPPNTIVEGRELADDEFSPVGAARDGNGGGPARPVIPPFDPDYAITTIQAYTDDVILYTIWPHMHVRGKEMTYVLTYPDGREQILLANLNYDYNWQLNYELKEPLRIPAGSTIKLVGSLDNSPKNRGNPQPDREVYWSEQAWDEMYNGFRDYSVPVSSQLETSQSRR